MASELSVDAVRDFIALNDGKVKNTILVAHFRKFLNDPQHKAEARQKFKDCVNTVAVVKTESGEKYVQLKKKFRTAAPLTASVLPTPEIPETHSTQASPNHISSFDNPIIPESENPILYAGSEGYSPPIEPDQDQELCFPPPEETQNDGMESSMRVSFEPPTFINETAHHAADSTERNSTYSSHSQAPRQMDTSSMSSQYGGVKVSSHEVFPDMPTAMDSSGQFRVPAAPGRKRSEPKENIPPSNVVLSAHKSRGYSHSGSSTPDLHRRPRPLSFVQPSGAVERARLNFQPGKKFEADDAASITQSERSVDSSKDTEHEYDDDRPVAPFAMDPLEKQWMLQATRGSMVELRKLLNQDPNLAEKRDFMMGTALHWAAKKGHLDLVKMFGDIGVDVNAKSNGGYTPLHMAAMHGHEKVLQVLVDEYDADTVVRDYTGKQARDYLRTGSISLPIQKVLFGNNGTGSVKAFAAGLRPRLDSVRKSQRIANAISGGVGALGAMVRGRSTSTEELNMMHGNSPSVARRGSFKSKMKKKSRKWSGVKDERPTISLMSTHDETDSGFGGGISGSSSMSSMPEMRRGHSASPSISRPSSTHSRESNSSRPRGESTGSKSRVYDE